MSTTRECRDLAGERWYVKKDGDPVLVKFTGAGAEQRSKAYDAWADIIAIGLTPADLGLDVEAIKNR